MANYFDILNHRPTKFGIGNDYGFLYRLIHQYLVVHNCFWQSLGTLLSSGNSNAF